MDSGDLSSLQLTDLKTLPFSDKPKVIFSENNETMRSKPQRFWHPPIVSAKDPVVDGSLLPQREHRSLIPKNPGFEIVTSTIQNAENNTFMAQSFYLSFNLHFLAATCLNPYKKMDLNRTVDSLLPLRAWLRQSKCLRFEKPKALCPVFSFATGTKLGSDLTFYFLVNTPIYLLSSKHTNLYWYCWPFFFFLVLLYTWKMDIDFWYPSSFQFRIIWYCCARKCGNVKPVIDKQIT